MEYSSGGHAVPNPGIESSRHRTNSCTISVALVKLIDICRDLFVYLAMAHGTLTNQDGISVEVRGGTGAKGYRPPAPVRTSSMPP